MNALSDLKLPRGMSSSRHNLMRDFYTPCLSRAKKFDRAAGYFSSAIFALAPLSYSDFFLRGGRIRLVSSTHLSPQDAAAVEDSQPFNPDHLISFFLELEGEQSKNLGVLGRILSSLLNSGALELKFAEPVANRGVFHDKYGIFSDGQGGVVSFIGSTNETAYAWSGLHNHEQIEIFSSNEPADKIRINDHVTSFDRIWANDIPGYTVFSSAEFESRFLTIVPPEPLEELVAELRMKEASASEDASLESAPVYTLRNYQRTALENWKSSEQKGIISFATGGGKTLTAIDAISRWLDSGTVLVLVPSRLLLEQWKQELKSWIPGLKLLQVGGGNPKSRWIKTLFRFSQPDLGGKRVILATYASASSSEFRQGLSKGPHLMVVADEVHRFGASDTRQIGEWLECGPRLGLSATPIREGDSEGTEAILKFFGDLLEPVYSLRDAIDDGVLVPYDYQIELAPLSETEQEEWDQLSIRISRELAIHEGERSDLAKRLMIKRARISKGAASKAPISAEIIRKNYSPKDRWLVYCESVTHLHSVKKCIQDSLGDQATIMEFHSENKEEHKRVIDYFEAKGGVVLAIKCLDEGIDIPIINRAIVLSSSTNPREYIQRRGRVLRRHPNKSSAQIWDLLTVGTTGMPIAQSEVSRAAEFAIDSRNQSARLKLDLMSDRAARVEASEFDLEDTVF